MYVPVVTYAAEAAVHFSEQIDSSNLVRFIFSIWTKDIQTIIRCRYWNVAT